MKRKCKCCGGLIWSTDDEWDDLCWLCKRLEDYEYIGDTESGDFGFLDWSFRDLGVSISDYYDLRDRWARGN